jgi:hypothetical protein
VASAIVAVLPAGLPGLLVPIEPEQRPKVFEGGQCQNCNAPNRANYKHRFHDTYNEHQHDKTQSRWGGLTW